MNEIDCSKCIKEDVCKYKRQFEDMCDKAFKMNVDIPTFELKYTVYCGFFVNKNVSGEMIK